MEIFRTYNFFCKKSDESVQKLPFPALPTFLTYDTDDY